ncbi:MAG: M20/M25/M40 family metallo-hydrolase [Candidatus Bathyarchaeota archaeon]|nr:MAG: M20/M25/M40 family metallo-hydrolase [Candidatus Bathyarchaeota archaeon]
MVSDLASGIEASILGDIWLSNEAFENLTVLCDDFGSRFAGTEGERPAVDFIVSKLKEYGLENVVADEFAYTGWRRGEAKLEMLTPKERELETISLAMCPPTPSGGVEADIVYLGPGYPELFLERKDEIDGKIVLCTSQPRPSGEMVHRRTKYGYAVKFGAVGFVFVNHNAGQLMPTGSIRPAYRMAGEISGIGVSWETGCYLVRQLEKGPVRVRITTTDVVDPEAISWNVIGEIPGGEMEDRVIAVGAHFDGHDIAVGALDDGAGAVTVMEASRVLAKHKGEFKRTIRFICFAAEEIGVTGSTCYVDKHIEEINGIDLMINCDGAGRADSHVYRVSGPEHLVGYLQGLVDRMNYDMRVVKSSSAASDHWPFYLQGVPAVTLSAYRGFEEVARVGRGWGHTSADTLDKVNPKHLKDAAMVLAQSLVHLANEEGVIAERTPVDEIVMRLEKSGMVETLRIQRKWHPGSIR